MYMKTQGMNFESLLTEKCVYLCVRMVFVCVSVSVCVCYMCLSTKGKVARSKLVFFLPGG